MPALPRSFSVSAAGLWRQCPRRWRFRYVEKRADPPGEPALLGTFVHRVLELLCAEPADGRDLDRARELAAEAWPDTADDPDYVALGHDAEAQRHFKWRGWRAIEALWQIENPADVEVRATEAKVQATVGGVPFFGIIDRLDVEPSGLVVTDYKTGKAPRPGDVPTSLDQVLVYSAAVEDHLGERPSRGRLYYLGSGVHETEVTEDGLGGAVERFTEAWSQVGQACSTDDFPPDVGPLCGWCPYVTDCVEGSDEVRRWVAKGRLPDAPARILLGITT
ncbi:MAG: PD-(D/E)XK nuclease family protein [Actinomycetota bacterium]|nr:PD-(D/E)XK nuclease family protein [Actinomycetota bacterium]MEC9395738.1 PD-(D/E)XK nuclease family protein [Actinomycetota bacterium]MED6327748.1 PD-(D/E)XK nuclease family protein [Actinomycetota bacterium]MEE2958607.1 PD-(D/E)XK nuclease family protein [Actinomycetota bacterium]